VTKIFKIVTLAVYTP